ENWSAATVRTPMMLTLALTVVVPLTVEPEVGDVIVTIRLPSSCAEAGSGTIQAQLKITNSAAAQARLMFMALHTWTRLQRWELVGLMRASPGSVRGEASLVLCEASARPRWHQEPVAMSKRCCSTTTLNLERET